MELEAAAALGRALLAAHGLAGWEVRLSGRLLRTYGRCVAAPGRPGRIELSAAFVRANDEGEVRDTLLHEIAHALVGPERGHDAAWAAACRRLGCRPDRLNGTAAEPPGRYRAVCPRCGTSIAYYRRPRAAALACRGCGPAAGPLTFTDLGTP